MDLATVDLHSATTENTGAKYEALRHRYHVAKREYVRAIFTDGLEEAVLQQAQRTFVGAVEELNRYIVSHGAN
jgi:hypothetical protein